MCYQLLDFFIIAGILTAMQTFLPYPDFKKSAKSLDRMRLGKQRVEAFQILKALTNPTYGWRNHPATKMWDGHEYALCLYGVAICREWISRGYKDTMLQRFVKLARLHKNTGNPIWLGSRKFHKSHKSNLLRKYPEYYSKLFKNTPNNLPYIWPI